MVLFSLSEPYTERVKISLVIFECRVVNHCILLSSKQIMKHYIVVGWKRV